MRKHLFGLGLDRHTIFRSRHQIAVVLDDLLRGDAPFQNHRGEVVRVAQVRKSHDVIHDFAIAKLEREDRGAKDKC